MIKEDALDVVVKYLKLKRFQLNLDGFTNHAFPAACVSISSIVLHLLKDLRMRYFAILATCESLMQGEETVMEKSVE